MRSADRADPMPSWRGGSTRDDIDRFLAASHEHAPSDRVAVFDNDGTLWCERPAYPQLSFFVDELKKIAREDPVRAERAEYAALLHHDAARISELGLPRIAMALAELFIGMSPDEFSERCRRFVTTAVNPMVGSTFAESVYQPMLELLEALRAHGFTTFIVTGGGTEFVRAVSEELYGVPPERVVGTMIGYEYVTQEGTPALVRTADLVGVANEGAAKVINIRQQLGRRPVLAAGNSLGDREMIDWAVAADGPTLGLLIDHDDAEREDSYASVAGSFESSESVVDVGRRSGWTVVSMQRDWSRVFPRR